MLISGEGYSSILSSEYPLLGTKPFPALRVIITVLQTMEMPLTSCLSGD